MRVFGYNINPVMTSGVVLPAYALLLLL